MLNHELPIFGDARKFNGLSFELVDYSNMFSEQDKTKLERIQQKAKSQYQIIKTVTNRSGMKAVYGYPVQD